MESTESSQVVRVTVIVPSFNHKKYIIQCLDSIRNQTYSNFQWIVVDDGSTDGSQDLLKEKQSYYGYELYLQENKGVSATLTDMIKNHARGDLIACCASDDAWLPDKLQIQVNYMDEHPTYSMCYGLFYMMDTNSRVIGRCNEKKYHGGRIFRSLLYIDFDIPPNEIIRKEVLSQLGYYKEGVIAEDFYIFCKIAHDYEIGFIPTYISYYRVAPLHTKRDPLALRMSHEDVIKMYKNEPIFEKAYSKHCVRCFVLLSSYKKYKSLSLRYLFKAKLQDMNLKSLSRGIYHLIRWWV